MKKIIAQLFRNVKSEAKSFMRICKTYIFEIQKYFATLEKNISSKQAFHSENNIADISSNILEYLDN